MDKLLLRIFQSEVKRQCRFALFACDDLTEALLKSDTYDSELRKKYLDRVWYSIQSFLVAVGNISKLLWPNQSPANRGEKLRQSVNNVDENSPLQVKTFRNHFEHFDERLEKWATSSTRHNFVDSNIGSMGGQESGDFMRNFDPNNYAVTFQGSTYELKPIIAAVKDLHVKAALEADKPHWE